jgi:hypothetical protein
MKKLVVFSLLAFLILLQLARADIMTDKETYKPEETIGIRLSSANVLTGVAPNALDFSASPNVINETVSEITENTIELENSGNSDVSISEIIVLEDVVGVISIVQRPYIIPPNSKSILKIRIDPSNLPQGSYNATISVLGNKGVIPVQVNLQVITSTKIKQVSIEDYSFIIWTFAIFIVVVIVTITILRYRKIMKKKSKEKKKIDEEKKKEDTYYKSQEEYRTEYY